MNTSIGKRKTVQELVHWYEIGWLCLEPSFQRKSVWSNADRKKLICSMLEGFPIPAIFLYKRENESGTRGDIVYDVIDGKQRIEAIFHFLKVLEKSSAFSIELLKDDGKKELCDEKSLKKLPGKFGSHANRLMDLMQYEIPVIEVEGDFSEIVRLFVLINSTGKALSAQEKRNANYCNSAFLKTVSGVARSQEENLKKLGVVSQTAISRMKHIELVAELMISFYKCTLLDKKKALDATMAAGNVDVKELERAKKETVSVLNWITRYFPRLKTTRFSKRTDFYSLACLLWEFKKRDFVMNMDSANLAWEYLKEFGAAVDELREKQRLMKKIDENAEASFKEYLETTAEGTDSLRQRKKRHEILERLLKNLFQEKDTRRIFSEEQRRVIWARSENKRCARCGAPLTFEDFTIDHVVPHSRGGKTLLANAEILCRSCNSSKGNR